jgi:hypothetical protein
MNLQTSEIAKMQYRYGTVYILLYRTVLIFMFFSFDWANMEYSEAGMHCKQLVFAFDTL